MHMSQSCRSIKPKYDFFPTKNYDFFPFTFLTFDISSFFSKDRDHILRQDLHHETTTRMGKKFRNFFFSKKQFCLFYSPSSSPTASVFAATSRPAGFDKIPVFRRNVKLANPRIFRSDVSTSQRIYSFFSSS